MTPLIELIGWSMHASVVFHAQNAPETAKNGLALPAAVLRLRPVLIIRP